MNRSFKSFAAKSRKKNPAGRKFVQVKAEICLLIGLANGKAMDEGDMGD